MPKVDYEKYPFRLCRWNTKPHDNKPNYHKLDEYFCEDSNEYVNEEHCMQCFCNDWYQVCERCSKTFLKTELKQVFEKNIIAMAFVCNNCYKGEELVQKIFHEEEENIISNIKKWKKLRGN